MKKVLVAVVMAAGFLLAACGDGASNAPATLAPVPAEYAGKSNPLGPEAAVPGGEIFKVSCEPCHGAQGHGDGPAGQALDPKPKNLPDIAAMATDDYLFWRISTGKEGTSMVAWKGTLSEEQIWQIVAFIRTLK